ncbi:hypothetical protein MUK42_07914 [Musa troglodytarum]|uniref:Uncharacterized protein n=1 Tax=Musa troglodytarum TaxID=320322 RepID=A0A9E7I0A6_9LILI|nr:hypothetical protein MUK42_07914 [Musa troglodytarum]
MTNKMNMEVEDDEDADDVDFNPTWRGESLSEASSGLSSDNEATGDDIGEVFSGSLKHQGDGVSPRKSVSICRNLDSGTEDEEIVMQNRVTAEDVTGKDVFLEKPEVEELNRFNWQEEESAHPEGSYTKVASGDESDAAEELTKEELPGQATSSSNSISLRKQAVEIDDEDAICKRTRARHSLANYTLEELEAFLQESDDDDDLQNVDDEEEYHKFLAAVLLGGDGNGQAGQDDEILDEDEENDADFAIEIEEALESDIDESFDDDKRRSDKNEEDVHRPETRQKKRLRESAEKKKCFLGLDKMPLRPILPYVSNAQIAPVPALGLRFHSPESFSHCPFAFSGADLTHGFTYQQLGQLYCLIHEHVQLLIQVFSVSVLDSSRQQVAMEVQELIMEMVVRHEEGLARRKAPYDMSCFQAPNIHASLQIDSSESSEFSHWTPSIDGPIFSILDVVPLQLAKSYMADVSATVLRYRQSQLDDPVDKSHLKREPLFPFPMLTCQMGTDQILYGEPNGMPSKTALPPLPGQLPPKKSLAATLVENTKKQTVALVPMEIAKLAKRFYPLFNLALFPHKPPVPAVANRVLFTDAEDELLAMGLRKYNNDWGAIQKHFLPCKTKHQIFVRQKNRSSSKAPANPIKGLKLFKQDWLSVWKYFVPHRDPSLLPRQWRIATGTQKSYRKSEAIKEKRRLYEAKRRRLKASMADGHTLSEKEVDNEEDNSGEDMDKENEAYVHEAFLSDSETGSSNNLSYEISLAGIDRISGSRNSIDAPLDLFSVDFHPLLRRTNNATADLAMVSSVDPGVFPASSHHNKLSHDSNAVSRENLVGNSQIPAGGASLCHHEKENELDLDIHLYSVKENEKTRQAGDSSMHQFNKSGSPTFQPSMGKGIDADMSFHYNANCSESVASHTRGCGDKDVNSLEVVQMPNDCLSQCTKDYDESDLDIIMEQEELSDSDDESANVEFECEEIDDSEDDESEYGQLTEALIKEVPTAAVVRKSNQDSCNFNHSRQSMRIRQGSVEEEINGSSLQQSCQNPCHTLRLKPKHEDAKRDISSKSSQEQIEK